MQSQPQFQSNMQNNHQQQLRIQKSIAGKVVILGSRGVGKTCLVTKYIKNTLHKDVEPTQAALFFTCKVTLDDVKVKLEIWDTAGQERFKAVAPMYYRDANAAILVFDLSQYNSFTDITYWIRELHRNVQDPLILTLVGNKFDLHATRVVAREEAQRFAVTIGANYVETSAEADQGLEQVFNNTAMGLVRLAREGKCRSLRQYDSSDSICTYTNNNTAFNYSAQALAHRHNNYDNGGIIRLPGVAMGKEVECDAKTTAEGRLETPSWSIDHIALGEVEPVSWCC